MEPHEIAYMSVYADPGWRKCIDPRACLASTLQAHPLYRGQTRKFTHHLVNSIWCRKYLMNPLVDGLPKELYLRLHQIPLYVNFRVVDQNDSVGLQCLDSVILSTHSLANLLRLPSTIIEPECAVWYACAQFNDNEKTCTELYRAKKAQQGHRVHQVLPEIMVCAVIVFIMVMCLVLMACLVLGFTQ